MIAFKTFADCPEEQRVEGVLLSWPWIEVRFTEAERAVELLQAGWRVMTENDYESYKRVVSPTYNVTGVIESAMEFGKRMMTEFGTKNVLRGYNATQITQVSTELERLQQFCMSGSLNAAYQFILTFQATELVIEEDRLEFKNKIEDYLGIPHA